MLVEKWLNSCLHQAVISDGIEINVPPGCGVSLKILCNLISAREPNSAFLLHGPNEILQQSHARGTAAEPRMERQDKATSKIVHGLKFPPPKVEHFFAILGNKTPGWIGIESELFPVFEHPLAGNFDQTVFMEIRH